MRDNDFSKKKNLVKEKIRDYIKEYYRRLNTPGYTTNSINVYKFKNLEAIKKRLAKEDKIDASKSTIQLALSELKETIEKKDGFYQYTDEALRANQSFPILNFASNTEIINLNPRDFCFLRVFPNIASEVANYLNTVMIPSDIYSVAIGDIIMCIDVGYMEDTEEHQSHKSEDFKSHIQRVLQESKFSYVYYSYIGNDATSESDLSDSENTIKSETEYSPKPSQPEKADEEFDRAMSLINAQIEQHVINHLPGLLKAMLSKDTDWFNFSDIIYFYY